MELTKIKGISDKREEEFNKCGIYDTADLVRLFPRRYLDLTERQSLLTAYHNDMILTVGTVVSVPQNFYAAKRGFVRVFCEQEGLSFSVIWFHSPFVLNKLRAGEPYLFYGRVRKQDGVISLVNPSFEPLDGSFRLQGIVPQYFIKGNLPQKTVRDSVRYALTLEHPSSLIPAPLQTRYRLSDIVSAYKTVHNPKSFDDLKSSSDRIAVEEYFAMICALRFMKGDKETARTKFYDEGLKLLPSFLSSLPFTLTDGQNVAVKEIVSDLKGETVMNRLLQGDVGSGKTVVALSGIFAAVKSGHQAVFLAPTEVLARQNFEVAKKFLPTVSVGLLVGSMTQKEKNEVKKKIESGEISLLCGTHAVLEPNVVFSDLTFCVCDEQQRFGVAQRSKLTEKSECPDMLVMSATPIPRTLSLLVFGDLDVTTIPDKPKDRIPIQTNIVSNEKIPDMLSYIEREVKAGKQVYFVCPKIEGDTEGEALSALETFNELSEKLHGVRLGLLHGKMKDVEKTDVMRRFKEHDLDAIVSTTVIEVGVDVPNASIMVIFGAERFGLSQLHQLRGRVGRSDIKSYCFLLLGQESPAAIERLKVVKENENGFDIAGKDFEMRGGGDFIGYRQSGKFMSDLGNLRFSADSIYLAKKIADEFFGGGFDVLSVKDEVLKRYEKLKDVSFN